MTQVFVIVAADQFVRRFNGKYAHYQWHNGCWVFIEEVNL